MNRVVGSPSKAAAFFDVDGTLFDGSTIASFIEFLHGELGNVGFVNDLLELKRLAPTYRNRERLIRDCFRLFAGQSWSEMIAFGQHWYQQAGRDLLIPEAVDRARNHTHDGHTVVLVSGSWLPCLLPVARAVGAEYVFGCEVEVINGRLTGDVFTVMISEVKATTVTNFAVRHDLDLASCFGYGNDRSDEPMLTLLGHPTPVRPSPELAATANSHRWNLLPRSDDLHPTEAALSLRE